MINFATYRVLSTVIRRNWNALPRKTFLSFCHQSSHQLRVTALCHNQAAFWDIEGSVAVSKDQTGNLEYLAVKEKKKEVIIPELSDVVRITKFGHIRLDDENVPKEQVIEQEIASNSSISSLETEMNFIDNQFFGADIKHQLMSPQLQSLVKPLAREVPLDTNVVDQQYFYPNQPTIEKEQDKSLLKEAPSASELAFDDNEIDDQYFGTKSGLVDPTLPGINVPKSKPGRVSALEYIRSQKSKEEKSLSKDPAKSTEDEDNNEVGRLTHEQLIPNFRKLPNEIIFSILKKCVIYNQGMSRLKSL